MHRLRAAALRGDQHIEVRLVEGTAEDAFVLAVVLNAEHGLPLSRQDRTAAAQRIIESHPHWSDRRIASVTGLSPSVVGALRRQADVPMAELSLRTGRDGRSRPVDLVAGRIAASRVIAESPDASLREIAGRAGVALATARDVRNRIRLGQDPVPPKLRTAGSGPEQTGADADPAESGQHHGDDRPAGSQEPQPVRPVPPPAAAVTETVLARMRRDPSLRMSQTGRALLHLLAAHLLTDEQRQDLVAGVPAHRAADVAHVARLCADRWLQFATDVEGSRAQAGETASGRGRVPSLSPGA
ncbi:ParB/RepB/Spo0J family partition protein [Actinacidiphila acididurans]|nr:ParB/RepB/Spo0J family partition protein [Actinacidiphila acididurans]